MPLSGKSKAVLNTLMRIDQSMGILKSSPGVMESFSSEDLNDALKELQKCEDSLAYWASRFRSRTGRPVTGALNKMWGPVGESLGDVVRELSQLLEADEQGTVAPKVGDILVSSWGYDQTNIDFYQVVGVTKASVKIREILKKRVGGSQTQDMMAPEPGQFDPQGKTLTKRFKPHYSGKGYTVKIESYSWASLWDGVPRGETAFGYGH